ncbi:MAG: Gfo/Idh/MocA family oxidoreductase [Microbacterium sp.]|uniref:Gfo/Idh/MocA family protein n=1 Tax=Microbacterium sp. TaxID=51671 RepID=UPI001AD0522C|nr:Gfo/Idh/MocA family oxidoreductase [Microbacterium sp.]MBN9173041.1 Gfo/Idh/MocA family oxidoreductase [Microbacterium sp.]
MNRVGIVGLGVISRAYLDTLADAAGVRIVAVPDLHADRAAAAAAGIPGCRALTPAALYADPEVDTVLNLTIPAAHEEVALAALAAGKDVYGEKPLAATLAAARTVVDAAAAAGRRLGCAPDTVLGTGVQTARAAVEAGTIGAPVGASATWVSAGHESWHPHPDFYYRAGGGPLLDMGPYYLTSLVHLLGPVAWVQGASSRARDTRVIATGPRAGESIPVEVETHVTGVLGHAGGALSTVTFSFDAVASRAEPIEVYGVDGMLVLPDPNHFSGSVHLRRAGSAADEELPVSAGYQDAARGVGLLDFVAGDGRASGDVALHVLEVMTALLDSAAEGARIPLTTTVEVPPLVPLTPAARWHG